MDCHVLVEGMEDEGEDELLLNNRLFRLEAARAIPSRRPGAWEGLSMNLLTD